MSIRIEDWRALTPPTVVFLLRNSFSRSFLYNRGGFIRGRKRGEGGEEAALINADAFLLVAAAAAAVRRAKAATAAAAA